MKTIFFFFITTMLLHIYICTSHQIIQGSLTNLWMCVWENQDYISCWIFDADDWDLIKLKIKKIMWNSSPSLFIHWRDFMFHPRIVYCFLLCFCRRHNERRKEEPSRKPDTFGLCCLIFPFNFFLLHFFFFKLSPFYNILRFII